MPELNIGTSFAPNTHQDCIEETDAWIESCGCSPGVHCEKLRGKRAISALSRRSRSSRKGDAESPQRHKVESHVFASRS
jgi:hypothetical protein